MADFVLRPSKQKTIMRCLLLASPIFLFHPLMQFMQGILVPGLPPVPYVFNLWIMGAPYIYFFALLSCFFERIRIKDGNLEYGLLGLEKVPLSRIAEVGGDEGDVGNDFNESILIKFDSKDSTKGLVLPIKAYDEHELRAFLNTLREQNPAGEYTYQDVIPFESRGLIRFLSSMNDSDSLIVKLSKTPMEDAIINLVKGHERIFWFAYLVFWLLVLFSASYYCILFNESWSQNMVTPVWDTSQDTRRAAVFLDAAQKNPASNWLDLIYANVCLAYAVGVDFIATSGLATLISVWSVGAFMMAVVLPIAKLLSPTYLFIDSKSIGMREHFYQWQSVTEVTLEKIGVMGDPLEGRLVMSTTSGARFNFDLTTVPDVQKRQRILRLVDRYAVNASFNGEFMRTTNMLVDIQFTDLWLEEQGETSKVEAKAEVDTLGKGLYKIDSMLGYGGQGVTYLASLATAGGDGFNSKNEQVVIKELVLPNYADVRIMQDATSRFERGASLLKELGHPKVVKLIDSFLENGKAYLVMEYVQGETLRDFIEKRGAMPFTEAKQLGLQLCEILEYLHERETPVIHCDFAPDNLIITPSGEVKLIDFDVARVVDNKAHTFIAGRPSYTPPEQFRGQPTTQSDLFALGAILHYLLQGKDPPPLCAGSSDEETVWNSSGVEELIQQCCQFEAGERPGSAREIKESLLKCEVQFRNDGTNDPKVSVSVEEETSHRLHVPQRVEENA